MNGFSDHHHDLHDVDFREPKGVSVRTFDAFPKTKPHYLTKTQTGGPWTIALFLASALLILVETRHWFAGTVNHSYTVEKGVSHQLQINVDVVVAMQCADLHVNVQDASGDRILAGEQLKRDPTNWGRWTSTRDHHKLKNTLDDHALEHGEDEDVHDYLGLARKSKRKFSKTPRVRGAADACRIYGSLEGNKVQGDFHITARGHGYMEFGMHLDHSQFNFSHHVNELSFGPYYPSLINPLDNTFTSTNENFYKFQYYCNIVPTIYTTDIYHLHLNPHQIAEPLTNLDPSSRGSRGSTVWTNQYAVTEQSHSVPETAVPGVFFKYDIEPLLLVVNEQRGGFIALLVRLVNVVSGVLVAGTWLLQFTDWAVDNWSKNSGSFGGSGRERLGFLGTKDERYV